ncbi:hypothetical protein [uncultured Lacinutrix sp.]|uniref:hypothetical protein n=1 Tax=uncultured Lacinutrix sp. TaxID=574032 RepID=UPI002629C60F|nr:hypothetical protein [uncultured Lacinutrix sp.]
MKTLKTQFSTVVKTVLILTLLLSFSCSKDDDNSEPQGVTYVTLPASVINTYTGTLAYQTPSATVPIENTNGTATIVATGDKVYKITFSDGVPELTGFRFISSNGNFTSATTGNSSEGVSINGGTELSVGITANGSNWSFSGDN